MSGEGIDREAYVRANERLFEQLPGFPGSGRTGDACTAYRESESGPVVGFGTLVALDLPVDASAAMVAWFFERRLQRRWRLVEILDGPVLNFRRENAFVSVNLENASAHAFEIAIDHAYYGKLGR